MNVVAHGLLLEVLLALFGLVRVVVHPVQEQIHLLLVHNLEVALAGPLQCVHLPSSHIFLLDLSCDERAALLSTIVSGFKLDKSVRSRMLHGVLPIKTQLTHGSIWNHEARTALDELVDFLVELLDLFLMQLRVLTLD